MKASEMNGKLAVVTGVVGDIGRAAALALARRGADVFLVDRSYPALAALAEDVRAEGVEAHLHEADITSREACFGTIEAALETCGRIDALCNIANAFLPSRTESTPGADWEFSLAHNLSAPFYLMQAALPHLVQRAGAIVNMTSCAACTAQPCTAAYTASKAGLLQMTRAIATEYGDSPVRINVISPGDLSPSKGSISRIPDDLDAERFHKGGARSQVTAAEVGELVAFLASDAARTFHGALIPIDNGIGL